MPPDGTAAIAQTPEDLRAKIKAQVAEGKPAFFKLEAQLPQQGRGLFVGQVASKQQWRATPGRGARRT